MLQKPKLNPLFQQNSKRNYHVIITNRKHVEKAKLNPLFQQNF